jgi:DNA (cytosine-5)-methyltransferase 1
MIPNGKKMRHGSLFSGIGGFDLAAEWMRWENVFHCEWMPFPRKILNYHFPNSISYEDITKTDFTQWRNRIDIITGGVPCQPFSKAGKMLGSEDERYLWDDYIRVLREIKPRWFVAENVSGLLTTDNGKVLSAAINMISA